MKKKISLYFLISSFILLSSIAEGASIYNPTLAIYPNAPITELDLIYAELGGDFATSGYTVDNAPLVTITDYNIGIDFNSSSPPPDLIVLTVLTPFSVNADIGLLSTGVYNVNANFYVDGILEQTVTDSFTVSSVPIPAGAWLFGSGLLGLIGIAKRKK